jgi:hypothetical protein
VEESKTTAVDDQRSRVVAALGADVACVGCGSRRPVTEITCATCGTELAPRLFLVRDRDVLPWAWWLGVVPAFAAITLVQWVVGAVIGDALGLVSRYGTAFAGDAVLAIVVAPFAGGACVMGPLLLASRFTAELEECGHVTPRLRFVSIVSIPMAALSLVPLLGMLPGVFAFEVGRRGQKSAGERPRCPACDYDLPEAGRAERVRCPECGRELEWGTVRGRGVVTRWWLGTGGAVGIVLIGALAGIELLVSFDALLRTRILLLLLLFAAVGGAVMVRRRRRGWNDPAWSPGPSDVTLALAPLAFGLLAGWLD